MTYQFICHSTDTLLECTKPKGRIYMSSTISLNNSRYFVNDILRTPKVVQYSLLRIINTK